MRIVSLFLCLGMALPLQAATWYVRPATGEYGAEDGTSYQTAWDGLSSIVWGTGGVQTGDTLYACGTFTRNTEGTACMLTVGTDGAPGQAITIAGDYEADPAYIVAARVVAPSDWRYDAKEGCYTAYMHYNYGSYAWEGTPGGTELPLEPKNSVAEVAATPGSFYWDSSTGYGWYNPHAGSPLNVYYDWQTPIENDGHSYVTFRGLHLYCAAPTSGLITFDRGDISPASNVIVEGCTFRFAIRQALFNRGAMSYISITDNTFYDFSAAAIYISNSAPHIAIARNTFDGGDPGYYSWWGCQPGDGGAILGQPAGRWLIESNFVKRAPDTGIFLYKQNQVESPDVIIRYNRIQDISDHDRSLLGYGIAISGTGSEGWGDMWARCLIAYNVINRVSGTDGTGIRIKPGIPTNKVDRIRVVGNVISECNYNLYFRYVGITSESGLGVIVHNNISYSPSPGGYHVFVGAVSSPGNLEMSHNCWYPDTSGSDNRFAWNGLDTANYAAFVAATARSGVSIEEGSVLGDPRFGNPAVGDFTLQINSPCIDAGQNLGETYDDALSPGSSWPQALSLVDQDTYGRGWEIGPYAYTGINSPPVDIALSGNTVLENQLAGTPVGTFSTTDPDDGSFIYGLAAGGGTFTYSLVAGNGSADNGSFSISGNILQTRASFDYEVKNTYSIRARTTDAGGLWHEQTFIIIVADVNESPAAIQLSNSTVPEKQPAGTMVGRFSTADPDSADAFTYELVPGKGAKDNDLFRITGNLLRTVVSFDYGGKNSYTIRVRTTDSGGLSYEQAFTITVTRANQAPTAIQLSSSTVLENQPAGTIVGILSTMDPNSDDAFTYSLVNGKGGKDNNFFSISGSLLQTTASFDYEAKNTYSIRVRTTDSGGLTYVQAFTITVTDVDESLAALLLSNSSVPKDPAIGTTVGTLSIIDPANSDTFACSLQPTPPSLAPLNSRRVHAAQGLLGPQKKKATSTQAWP